MARNKPRAKKKRLIAKAKESVAAPVFAVLKKFGKRRSQRWRLNPHKRRSWRRTRTKA